MDRMTRDQERHSHRSVMTSMAPEHEMTFASMLKQAIDRRLVEELGFKLPDWAFSPATQQRRDQADLTEVERERFLCAYGVLNANGMFGSLVDIHADMGHNMHGTERFLPWHRVYLRQLELALQAFHPDVTLPYWDWTRADEQSIPAWLVTIMPTVVTPTRTIVVSRSPGPASDIAGYASNVTAIMAQTDFSAFTSQLEGYVHNGIHVWVGGSMSSVPTAPADPLFWMHHGNLDRLWSVWQASAQGTAKNPGLVGADAVMDPWPLTEPDTRDIAAMGYTYG